MKIIIISGIILCCLLIVIPFGFTVYIYEDTFGTRNETPNSRLSSIEDFNGLMREKYTFASNKNQELIGYSYYKEDTNPKGIIVFAHALGGGHNMFMNIADYFTSNDYAVFAYDGTGNDESAGDAVNGFSQGTIDLNYAINFVKQNEDFEDLPIMLMGHSMGGYAVGNVLNIHSDISAAVMVSGFNKSNTVFCDFIVTSIGGAGNLFLPYISVYERIKFGNYASYSSMDGFENTQAGIMIIHSKDDNVIDYEKNYTLFKENYSDNQRFEFIDFDNRGHEFILQKDSSGEYWDEYKESYREYFKDNNIESTLETREEYASEHFELSKLYDLDEELMIDILKFFNKNNK